MKWFAKKPDDPIIQAIRQSPGLALRPSSRDRLLKALLQEADHVTFATPPRLRNREQGFILIPKPMFVPVIIATLVIALGVGTAVASERAKPGDTLFGVDQALDQIKLTFALSDTAKARTANAIAAEREQELQELEQEHKTDAVAKAEDEAGKALSNAVDTIARVRSKLESKDNPGKAEESLAKVEDKLRDLRERHQERFADLLQGLSEAEVKFVGGKAIVKAEFNDTKLRYELNTTDLETVVRSIAEKTGVAADAVRSVLTVEREKAKSTVNTSANLNTNKDDEDDDEDEDDNVNTPASNANTNTPASNVNSPTNVNVTARWEIEVKVENGTAEIKAKRSGDEQQWTLTTTSQAEILASIAARTGLTTVEIQSIWKYEVEGDAS